MSRAPAHPKIYHITHVRNLSQIVEAGVLWSDAKRIEMQLDCDVVGMSHIKHRRLTEIEVSCHPGTFVGHYVPFYFCPRSIMLFILHRGNHPDLNYIEGQRPIVHLEADLRRVAEWADSEGRDWAFSLQNAGAYYARFHTGLDDLRRVKWSAVRATDFRDSAIKEAKQAEFLVNERFPWDLVDTIGVRNESVRQQVVDAIEHAEHRPDVTVKTDWYY